MKLFYSPRSPFVRKVMVVAKELGLEDRVEKVDCSPAAMDPPFVRANPIARIPTLVTDDGLALPESRLGCAYLDSLAGNRLIPAEGNARWRALAQEALADGFMEAAVQRRDEDGRPAGEKSPANLQKFMDRMNRCLDGLAAEVGQLRGPLTIGQIAVGCACGYADFRYPDLGWRKSRPELAAWYAEFEKRPSMQATIPAA